MEVVFGHLEVLHSKFHDPTSSNLGDQSGQTNRQTDKQTNKQTDNAIYIVDNMCLLAKLDCFWQPPMLNANLVGAHAFINRPGFNGSKI